MAKEKKSTEVVEVEETTKTVAVEEDKKKDSKADRAKFVEDFIARKLTAINQMEDEAKAKKLASKVLSNRKG